jgi:hypothetical protein
VFRHVAWGLLLEKEFTMKRTNYESEAYNRGWLDGYAALVVDLHKGFDGMLPTWLLEVIGGKKVVNSAWFFRGKVRSLSVSSLPPAAALGYPAGRVPRG